jgi:hypothetical protein
MNDEFRRLQGFGFQTNEKCDEGIYLTILKDIRSVGNGDSIEEHIYLRKVGQTWFVALSGPLILSRSKGLLEDFGRCCILTPMWL